eukprot:7032590-Prymnesium_polylepis.1
MDDGRANITNGTTIKRAASRSQGGVFYVSTDSAIYVTRATIADSVAPLGAVLYVVPVMTTCMTRVHTWTKLEFSLFLFTFVDFQQRACDSVLVMGAESQLVLRNVSFVPLQ